MNREDKDDKSTSAYPRPTEADKQLNNQPEYIDQQPNDFHDKSVSDIPGAKADKTANDPASEEA